MKKKNIAINKNILAVKNGEKSEITIGLIIATVPITNVETETILPISPPNIIHSSPFFAVLIAKNISGAQFPSPTINNPISIMGILNTSAK